MGILDNCKDVLALVQKADNIELYKEILLLQTEIYSLLTENQELKDQLKSIEKIKDIEKKLVYKENVYWLNYDGPYCTNCWDTQKTLVRLHSSDNAKGFCPNCKNSVIFNKTVYEKCQKEYLDQISTMNKSNTTDYGW